MPDAHREDIAKLESLYAEHPEGRIFTHLAEAYRKAGELDRAVEVLNSGLERHPDYSSAHVVMGRVLHDQGKGDDAAQAFRRVLDLDRHNLVALRALGDLARADGRDDEALDYYHRLLDVEPADEDVRAVIDEMTSASYADADLTWNEPSDAAFDAALDSVDQPEPSGDADPAFQEPVWLTGDSEASAPWSSPAGDDDDAATADDDWGQSHSLPESHAAPEHQEPVQEDPDTARDGGFGEFTDFADAESPEEPAEVAAAEPAEEAADEPEPAPTLAPGVMTETIAQVYARQGLYDRAAEVYRELVRARPGDQGLWDKLEEMEQLAASADLAAPDLAGPGEEPSEVGGLETTQFRPGLVDVERLPGLESDDIDGGTGLSVDDLAAASSEDMGAALEREGPTPSREMEPDPQPEPEAESEPQPDSDDDEPWADAPWAAAPDTTHEPWAGDPGPETEGGEEPVAGEPVAGEPVAEDGEGEDEAGAVWLPGALAAGEPEEPTPYAWAETEGPAEEDRSAPIHDYLRSILAWGGGGQPAVESSDEAVPEAAAESSVDAGAGAGTEPGPEPVAEGTGESSDDGDDDDDLDTFRSWLESLKQ